MKPYVLPYKKILLIILTPCIAFSVRFLKKAKGMTSMVICEIIQKDSSEACLWTMLLDYLYECGLHSFALFSIERSEFSFKTVFHRAQPAFSIIAKRILCTSWLLRSKRQMRQCTGSRFSMAPSLYQRISMMS